MTVVCHLVGETIAREVRTLEEMDEFLDLMAAGSNDEAGWAASFDADDDTTHLVVGVGRPLVPVFYGDERPDRPRYPEGSYPTSLGDISGPAGEEVEIWRVDTSWNEVDRNALVPEAAAREAAHEWFRTHARPTNIRWQK